VVRAHSGSPSPVTLQRQTEIATDALLTLSEVVSCEAFDLNSCDLSSLANHSVRASRHPSVGYVVEANNQRAAAPSGTRVPTER
jgi:hypothetical protein